MITVEHLANLAISACEASAAPYMLTGALAYNDDARDVLAVQGPETLDMTYIESWCATHGTTERLATIIESLPPL